MDKRKQLQEILDYIPSGAQTLSKNPSQYVIGVTPPAIERASGAYMYDKDGNAYLDMILALGPMIFGYANPRIDAAAKAQIDKGTIYSLPAKIELDLARVLREVVPCAEMSRFTLNGNDATSGAIRLARHITKRDHIAKCGYHGCQDWSICTKAGRNAGVPDIIKTMTHDFIYNDPGSLEKIFADHHDRIAAVILEPTSSEKPKDDFLARIKEIAHRNGSILIFDEMVTGFRWSLGGAQEYFGVTPDLACFGKAISGGFPISVICGKKEYMKRMDEVFVSMTFGGYAVGIAAALEAIAMMREFGDVHEHMHRVGGYLIDGGNAIANKHDVPISFGGFGPHPSMSVALEDYSSRVLKTFLYQEMIDAGILFGSSMMIGYIHTKEHIDKALRVFDSACAVISECSSDPAKILPKLKGDVIAPRAVRQQ